MRSYLITDPAIGSIIGTVRARSQLAALNFTVKAWGWKDYRSFLTHCLASRKANPGFGRRSLKAEPVVEAVQPQPRALSELSAELVLMLDRAA